MTDPATPKRARTVDPFASLGRIRDTEGVKVQRWRVVRKLEKLLAQMPHEARDNFAAFVAEVGRDHTGKPMAQTLYSRIYVAALGQTMAEGRHFAHVSPFGMGKSTLARLFMLWRIGNNPQLRTVVIGGSLGGSEDNVSLCRSILLSKHFQRVFPEVRPDYERSQSKTATANEKRDGRGWRKDAWFLECDGQRKDPTMSSVAAVPQREDMRVDLLLADDIITESTANSAASRDTIERAFWATWIEGRLSNGGQCIYLQNLRRQDDLAHKLRDDSRFCSVWVGIRQDFSAAFCRLWNPSEATVAAIEAIDPEAIQRVDPAGTADVEFEFPMPTGDKFAPEHLRAINASVLRRVYFLEPGDPGDALLPQFMLAAKEGRFTPGLPGRPWGFTNRGAGVFMPPDGGSLENAGVDVVGGLDWSAGKRRGKALTFVGRHRATGKMTPLYHTRIKGSMVDLCRVLDSLWAMGFRWQVLVCEANALQMDLNQAMRDTGSTVWRHTILDFTTTGNKADPIRGLPLIGTMLETQAFLWPAEAKTVSQDWALLESELCDTTADQVTQRNQTPDGLMSLWFVLRHLTSTVGSGKGERIRTAAPSPTAGKYGNF